MKIKILLVFLILLSCKSNEGLIHQKKIQTVSIKEDVSVTIETIKPSTYNTYYWYKSNEVHQSKGDYSGNLLHGVYTKHYITNQLAEKGTFNYGLKVSEWKSWFKNGQLKSLQNYSNGKLDGPYVLFNEEGKKISYGKYKKNQKTGKWIDYVTKDTTQYKKGKIVVKEKTAPFYKNIFKKKEEQKDVKS